MIRRLIFHPETFAISKFAVVGSIGFAVDAGLLLLGVYVFGTPPIPTRIFSVFISTVVTWVLNRAWTFDARREESAWLELLWYLATRAVGAACNVGIFAAAINWLPHPFSSPIIATPLSSGATMIIDYALARLFIYNPKKIGSRAAS